MVVSRPVQGGRIRCGRRRGRQLSYSDDAHRQMSNGKLFRAAPGLVSLHVPGEQKHMDEFTWDPRLRFFSVN